MENADKFSAQTYQESINGSPRPPLCEYIILAEFDIDTGSTVRIQYPSKIDGYADDWFAENMLPEGVHNRVSDYTYMFLNRDGHIFGEMNALSSTGQKPFLFGVNLCRTKYDSNVRRGAIVKAMAVFSRYSFIELFKKPLDLALEAYFVHPSPIIIERLFDSLNAVDTDRIPCPTATEQQLMRRGVVFDPLGDRVPSQCPQSWYHEINLKFNFFKDLQIPTITTAATTISPAADTTEPPGSPSVSTSLSPSMDVAVSTVSFAHDTLITASIPLYRTIDEVGDINVSHLLRIFGEGAMRIYNGIICGQRILFVGYSHAAADVALMVCSAAALVTPPLVGICRRMFPYANLTDLSFLQCPGYIAGVTNPMFQENDSWWDLLCILDLPNSTGTVKSAEEKRAEDEKSKPHKPSLSSSSTSSAIAAVANEEIQSGLDFRFSASLLSAVQYRVSEDIVRQKFYDHTVAILYQAQAIHAIYKRMTTSSSSSEALTSASSASPTPGSANISDIEAKLELVKERKHGQANAAAMRKLLSSNLQRAVLLSASADFDRVPTHSWPTVNVEAGDTHSGFHAGINELDAAVINSFYRHVNILNANSRLDPFALKAWIFRLQHEINLPTSELVQGLLQVLLATANEACAQALIILLPESRGGIHPIAAAMLSKHPIARYFATRLCQVLAGFESTKHAVDSQNGFIKCALERNTAHIREGRMLTDINRYLQSTTPEPAVVLSHEFLLSSMAGIYYETGSDAGSPASLTSSPAVTMATGSSIARQNSQEDAAIDMSDYIP